jgi:tryptophan synthase alpha chain
MNRINQLFKEKTGNILSVYFTAGYPVLDSAPQIIQQLAHAGVDMIEIGMPFSDPMADGPVIQNSSSEALKNGMTLKILFDQLKDIRKSVDIPLLLMGYLNPVIQYGFDKFCADCARVGIDGVILPDLPLEVMESDLLLTGSGSGNLAALFLDHNIHPVFLISPQTSEDRIRKIDASSKGFIYMVSSSATTGKNGNFGPAHTDYFMRIRDMKLKNPVLAGFGISGPDQYRTVCQYVSGAIVGTAFIKSLSTSGIRKEDMDNFVKNIRN